MEESIKNQRSAVGGLKTPKWRKNVLDFIDSESIIPHLEHFNLFCSHLGRRENKADKEGNTALLIVG